MKSLPFLYLLTSFACLQSAMAALVIPTVSSSANLDIFSNAGPEQLTNNSGLLDLMGISTTVDAGATVAEAAQTRHIFNGGFQQSYVTNARNGGSGDYFGAGQPIPVIVWDLGSVQAADNVVLWNYQNNGGGGNTSTNVGNSARVVRFDLGVTDDFSDPTNFETVMVTLLRANDPSFGSDINLAQVFALGGIEARFIRMTIEDNFFGQPGITAGGDRVGLGEIRFDVSPIPEPNISLLVGIACFSLIRRKRSRLSGVMT